LLFSAEEREKVERDLDDAKRRARESRQTPPGTSNDSGMNLFSSTDFGGV